MAALDDVFSVIPHSHNSIENILKITHQNSYSITFRCYFEYNTASLEC